MSEQPKCMHELEHGRGTPVTLSGGRFYLRGSDSWRQSSWGMVVIVMGVVGAGHVWGGVKKEVNTEK